MDKIRILLIDDHPIVRSGIRMLLEQVDDIAVVGEADRGTHAIDLVKRLKPDVLILDVEMPDKSGVEVAREICAAQLPVRILALSAHDDEQFILSLLSSGAVGYLTKEEALDTIVDAVRGVARGEEGWLSRRAAARMAAHTRKDHTDSIHLTEREEEVLRLLSRGWSNDHIAAELHLSERTVRFHLSNIYGKLEVSSRAEAIHWALTHVTERI
jgi:DNA-binding NarL/FixJ family response regulator